MKSASRAAPRRRALRIWLIAVPLALLLSLSAAVSFADTVPTPSPGPAPTAPDAKPTPKPGGDKDTPDSCDQLPHDSAQYKYCKEGGSGGGADGKDDKPTTKPKPEDTYNPMEP